MNTIIFKLKRAFQSSLRVTRPLLTVHGLTAARFDMLYAIELEGRSGLAQSQLRRVLGVSAPTVSRMLRSLEDLGLVTRARSRSDARQVLVKLTIAGLARIRRGIRAAIARGAVSLALDSALAGERWWDEGRCILEMDMAEWMLRRIASAFRDGARLHYFWHPDE